MVTLQILNKVLQKQEMTLILENHLDEEYFIGYENEFNFIVDHYNAYKKTPDKATFIASFPDFQYVDVEESDRYLLDTLYEEHLYYKSVGVVQKVAEILKTDSNMAVEYLQSQIPELQLTTVPEGTDIIKQADERLQILKEKQQSEDPWYITTGFPELDTILNGWSKGEEYVVIFARTGEGKSWVLAKTLSHAWELGNRVGYISPEMSPTKIGYRFDTLIENFSNSALVWGKDVQMYDSYIENLQTKDNPFVVATPNDFGKKVTVSKLKQFCISNKLDILGVDGITYMTDERYKKGDNKTTSLTNISEDLVTASIELGIPILVVVQSNRTGVLAKEEQGTPELEAIRDSDGIAQNATKVLSLRQTGPGLEVGVKKHRDGENGGKVIYYWDIDKGKFEYVPSRDDNVDESMRNKAAKQITAAYEGPEDVF